MLGCASASERKEKLRQTDGDDYYLGRSVYAETSLSNFFFISIRCFWKLENQVCAKETTYSSTFRYILMSCCWWAARNWEREVVPHGLEWEPRRKAVFVWRNFGAKYFRSKRGEWFNFVQLPAVELHWEHSSDIYAFGWVIYPDAKRERCIKSQNSGSCGHLVCNRFPRLNDHRASTK